MKNFVFVTTARSDFSFLSSIIDYLIEKNFKNKIYIIATGTHFDQNIGYTIKEIRKYNKVDLLEINPYIKGNEDAISISANILQGLNNINITIDTLIILGDRYEILPIANFATTKGIILVHFFGGECDISYCLDTLVRDAVTKMSHIHFVAHNDIKNRLLCMGEEERRIFIMGNPSVTAINNTTYDNEIFDFLKLKKIPPEKKLVNVCFHPVTTSKTTSVRELKELLKALKNYQQYMYIWSGINNDPGSEELKCIILEYVKNYDNHIFFDNLGKNNYFSLLKNSLFMIGNSSSGLLEAASFNLPVINIGERQGGRLHGHNVYDVVADSEKISTLIKKISTTKQHKYQNPFSNKSGLNVIYNVLVSLDTFKNLRYKKLNCKKQMTLQRVHTLKD